METPTLMAIVIGVGLFFSGFFIAKNLYESKPEVAFYRVHGEEIQKSTGFLGGSGEMIWEPVSQLPTAYGSGGNGGTTKRGESRYKIIVIPQ